MRTMTIPLFKMLLLNIILLVAFMRTNGGAINNCLIPHESNRCSCCKSGYRGPMCSDVCQHCLTRNVPGGNCTYYCETGYYGKTCDKECPITCERGMNGQPLCEDDNGLPVCVRCISGFYGKQCNKGCETNCLKSICRQPDGKCFSCIRNGFYGDYCRFPCSQGCVSGTCYTSGLCTHGCKFGFHGERCELSCGSNCKQGRCTSHEDHAYNCTEGCFGGYSGTSCLNECPSHCTECEQQSNRCTACVEKYVQKPETGECVEETTMVIVVPVVIGVIVAIVVIVVFILGIIIWKCRHILVKNIARTNDEQQNNGQREGNPMLPLQVNVEGNSRPSSADEL